MLAAFRIEATLSVPAACSLRSAVCRSSTASGCTACASASDNAAIALRVLDGERGPARGVVLLNAGAAIYVAGVGRDLGEGIERARASIDDGSALAKLEALRRAEDSNVA